MISSARTMFVNNGPFTKVNFSAAACHTAVPTMSEGIRSLVNWMRLNSQPRHRASVRARRVLPMPGMPSIIAWPRARSAIRRVSTVSSWIATTSVTLR